MPAEDRLWPSYNNDDVNVLYAKSLSIQYFIMINILQNSPQKIVISINDIWLIFLFRHYSEDDYQSQ